MANYPRLAQRGADVRVAGARTVAPAANAPRCVACRQPFTGRLFDPEVQLLIEGWRRCGPAWLCRDCS
ncbi:hypothetical protein LVJ94_29545 [Pendulispora rubella]|uniref:Uncharacterized protein n=1 Tax=Pendulispora rubella TaxID=2741070 RepID=A0ABZ2KR93_9BACT